MNKLLTTACAITAFAFPAIADTNYVSRQAQVLKSELVYTGDPVYERKKICRNETVTTKKGKGQDDLGSFLGGAIIGGIIGNAAGGNDGSKALGAILGGALANEHQKNKNTTIERTTVTKCDFELVEVQPRKQSCRTVVEVPSMDRYRFDFVSDKCYRVGDWISVDFKVAIN